ncbi:MAG: glycosyltransferase family 2 protein [Flavobacteriales bacterium]
MNEPFFSVVIPTYNRAEFLPTAVKSVLAQTFSAFELVVVDDGSEDNTEELMNAFALSDSRVTYIKQENKGRSTARNVGINSAIGQYICFLDSDDFWKPEHLASYHKSISSTSTPSFFYGGLTWWFVDENREQSVTYTPRSNFSSDVEFVIANEFAPDCVTIHRSLLNEHVFDPSLFINEDLELWARIAAKHPVVEVKTNTAFLRVHQGNTATSTEDAVSPRIAVFNIQLATKSVREKLSDSFISKRQKGFHELLIRHLEKTPNNRSKFIFQAARFILRYPTQPGNSAKLVSILYALPGGGILKRLINGSKASNG